MIVSPSILSADFLNLERDVIQLEQAGANLIHIDIMDGVFVYNITWGPSTIKSIRQITNLPLEVHLMIDKPERLMDSYLSTDADFFIIHPESTQFLRKTLLAIKNAGKKAGIGLKVETSVDSILHCLDLVDIVLIITCDEGFGGQSFQPFALQKIAKVARWRQEFELDFHIEVDGGINDRTAKQCKEVGANIAVTGSFVFKDDMKSAIQLLKDL